MFQESFKGGSRKMERCLNGVLSGFQGCFMEVITVFKGGLRGIPRDLQG